MQEIQRILDVELRRIDPSISETNDDDHHLVACLERANRGKCRNVIVDFRHVKRLSARELDAIMQSAETLREEDRNLIICGCPRDVEDLIAIVIPSHLVLVASSFEAALAVVARRLHHIGIKHFCERQASPRRLTDRALSQAHVAA
ncbi:MAG: hypothetical protein AAF899_00585 [Pseudomonadota bacterium]